MKRRSARPFTVEIKHTRNARISLIDATARTRKGPDLRGGSPRIAADTAIRSHTAPVAHPEGPSSPARRVLPSLVPTFSMPAEPAVPELDVSPAAERLPRVRRVKQPAARRQKPAAEMSAASAIPVAVSSQPSAIAEAPVTKPAPTSGPAAQPSAQVRTARQPRKSAELRPGERWKRRLPRVLR